MKNTEIEEIEAELDTLQKMYFSETVINKIKVTQQKYKQVKLEFINTNKLNLKNGCSHK